MENRKGFTLIETLIVVVIIILLSAIAVPSFKHLIASDRLQEVAWQMVQDLRTVKEDAILTSKTYEYIFVTTLQRIGIFISLKHFKKTLCITLIIIQGMSPMESILSKENLNISLLLIRTVLLASMAM